MRIRCTYILLVSEKEDSETLDTRSSNYALSVDQRQNMNKRQGLN